MLFHVEKLNALWTTKSGCIRKRTVFPMEKCLDVSSGFAQHPSHLTSLGLINAQPHRVQEGSLDAQSFFSVSSAPGYLSTSSPLKTT